MADKQITELPASSGVTNETQFPAYQPGALTPAQKVSGAQIAAFAEAAGEAAGEAAASDLQRGATFTPDYDPDTGILSWTNDSNLPNPEPEVVGGVSSFKGRTGAVVPKKGDYTPDMVGAVNKAGDTMTGNLMVSKSSYPQISAIDTTQERKIMLEYSSKGNAAIQNRSTSDSSNYTSVLVKTETSALNVLFQLATVKSGTVTYYNVLHTGNKPTGTYTGNGSATSRTIDTGGLGSVCVITSSKANCIVLANGAFYWSSSTTGAVAAGVCKFTNGVLTLATALDAFNANGITYTYQVL